MIINCIAEFIMYNNIFQQKFRNAQLEQEYEKIRRIRKIGIELADKGCRKLKIGEIP